MLNDATAASILSQARARALSLAGQLDSSALDEELQAALGAASQSAEAAPSEAASSEEVEEAEVEEEEEKRMLGSVDSAISSDE